MKLIKTFFLASLLFLSFFLIDNNSNIVKAESEFSKDIKKSTEFLHPDKAFIPILKKIDGQSTIEAKSKTQYFLKKLDGL